MRQIERYDESYEVLNFSFRVQKTQNTQYTISLRIFFIYIFPKKSNLTYATIQSKCHYPVQENLANTF